MSRGHGGRTRATGDRLLGLVWRRSDFRESSRLITLVTAEHGKLTTLGKGAHRPGSQCLGRIDFLNLVEVKVSRGSLPVLHRVRLVHEHRGLRDPARYRAASYLAEIFDPVILFGRGDPGLFELLTGGLKLLERCPLRAFPAVLAGLELRFLGELGLLPPLTGCSRCGAGLGQGPLAAGADHPGLRCRAHGAAGHQPVPEAALRWLDRIAGCPAREWPGLPPPPPGAEPLLGRWVALAIERRPRWRTAALSG